MEDCFPCKPGNVISSKIHSSMNMNEYNILCSVFLIPLYLSTVPYTNGQFMYHLHLPGWSRYLIVVHFNYRVCCKKHE